MLNYSELIQVDQAFYIKYFLWSSLLKEFKLYSCLCESEVVTKEFYAKLAVGLRLGHPHTEYDVYLGNSSTK